MTHTGKVRDMCTVYKPNIIFFESYEITHNNIGRPAIENAGVEIAGVSKMQG